MQTMFFKSTRFCVAKTIPLDLLGSGSPGEVGMFPICPGHAKFWLPCCAGAYLARWGVGVRGLPCLVVGQWGSGPPGLRHQPHSRRRWWGWVTGSACWVSTCASLARGLLLLCFADVPPSGGACCCPGAAPGVSLPGAPALQSPPEQRLPVRCRSWGLCAAGLPPFWTFYQLCRWQICSLTHTQHKCNQFYAYPVSYTFFSPICCYCCWLESWWCHRLCCKCWCVGRVNWIIPICSGQLPAAILLCSF